LEENPLYQKLDKESNRKKTQKIISWKSKSEQAFVTNRKERISC